MRWTGALLCLVLTLSSVSTRGVETFSEKLTLRSLADGRVASCFRFKISLPEAEPRNSRTFGSEDEEQHYTLFPLSLGQILRQYAVTELHLSLNAGKWDYARWGYPEEPSVGSGAELWTWMGGNSTAQIDSRWNDVRNALSGLFCASLGSMDQQRTTSPRISFRPQGSLFEMSQIRYATMTSEHVCTENLTPFIKLLPCKSRSGLAMLLNPHKLFDADWHGMGVHVTWSKTEGIQLELTFQAVIDPIRLSGQNKRDWSLEALYGRAVERRCSVAQDSIIELERLDDGSQFLGNPTSVLPGLTKFDLNSVPFPMDVSLQWPDEQAFNPLSQEVPAQTPFTLTRKVDEASQLRGQIVVSIQNETPATQEVLYLETMPWFVHFFLHTLKVTVNGEIASNVISEVSYTPPVAHERPMLFEARLLLPPSSNIRISMQFNKGFLRYTEHPPDAQRGWDLPPGVMFPLNITSLPEWVKQKQLYTPPLLVDLATPDFSMPYNVIIMSCTLIGLIFGGVFNTMTRRFVLVKV